MRAYYYYYYYHNIGNNHIIINIILFCIVACSQRWRLVMVRTIERRSDAFPIERLRVVVRLIAPLRVCTAVRAMGRRGSNVNVWLTVLMGRWEGCGGITRITRRRCAHTVRPGTDTDGRRARKLIADTP